MCGLVRSWTASSFIHRVGHHYIRVIITFVTEEWRRVHSPKKFQIGGHGLWKLGWCHRIYLSLQVWIALWIAWQVAAGDKREAVISNHEGPIARVFWVPGKGWSDPSAGRAASPEFGVLKHVIYRMDTTGVYPSCYRFGSIGVMRQLWSARTRRVD